MTKIGSDATPALDDNGLLPGLPIALIRAAYLAAPGNEMMSGRQFLNRESSDALAANTFGPFFAQAARLPPLPGTGDFAWPARFATPEATVKFPWQGGTHPCLDVLIATPNSLIGVESKRYEPFRKMPPAGFSEVHRRDVWGENMEGYQRLRDVLRDAQREGSTGYERLDAAQLVKQAFGLRTTVHRDARYQGCTPVLFYLYAEPKAWANEPGKSMSAPELQQHRDEVAKFAEAVAGDEVRFQSSTYAQLLAGWEAGGDAELGIHARAVRACFDVGI